VKTGRIGQGIANAFVKKEPLTKEKQIENLRQEIEDAESRKESLEKEYLEAQSEVHPFVDPEVCLTNGAKKFDWFMRRIDVISQLIELVGLTNETEIRKKAKARRAKLEKKLERLTNEISVLDAKLLKLLYTS